MNQQNILNELLRLVANAPQHELALLATILSSIQTATPSNETLAQRVAQISLETRKEISKEIAGREIALGDTLLSFDKSQLGDLTITDVAGRDNYSIRIENLFYTDERQARTIDRKQEFSNGELVFSESNWLVGDVSDKNGKFSRIITNEKYRWQIYEGRGSRIEYTLSKRQFSNFSFQVKTHQVSGEMNYGIIFRSDREHYYVFWLNKSYFSLMIGHTNAKYERIVPWTTHPEINPGQTNKLQVIAIEDDIHLRINNKFVAKATHQGLSYGEIGLIVASKKGNGIFEFESPSILPF